MTNKEYTKPEAQPNITVKVKKSLPQAIKEWRNKAKYAILEFKERKEFVKPSVKKRKAKKKAIYISKLRLEEDNAGSI